MKSFVTPTSRVAVVSGEAREGKGWTRVESGTKEEEGERLPHTSSLHGVDYYIA